MILNIIWPDWKLISDSSGIRRDNNRRTHHKSVGNVMTSLTDVLELHRKYNEQGCHLAKIVRTH